MRFLRSIYNAVASTIGYMWGYNATDPRRQLTEQLHGPQATTANELLNGNLPQLRELCRMMERNNPTARAAIAGHGALVVGSGIALEPDTGDVEIDKLIKAEFTATCEDLFIGVHDLYAAQRLAATEEFTAGAALWRFVPDPTARYGQRILPLDPEWIDSDFEFPDKGLTSANGIALDKYGRPQKYALRNPEYSTATEIVDAKFIVHIFEKRRPVQNHGEPRLAPVIEVMRQERDLTDVELHGAKISAGIAFAIESEYLGEEDVDTSIHGTSTDPATKIGVGNVTRLLPGDKMHAWSSTRPNQEIAPFRAMLRGDVAGALGIPQRFLDRDVGRANYSSMRADNMDTQRLHVCDQQRLGHQTAGRLYKTFLPLMSARFGLKEIPRANYKLLPDRLPSPDPTKDIGASLMAINGLLSTYRDETAAHGNDYTEIFTQAQKENEMLSEMKLSPSDQKGADMSNQKKEDGNANNNE